LPEITSSSTLRLLTPSPPSSLGSDCWSCWKFSGQLVSCSGRVNVRVWVVRTACYWRSSLIQYKHAGSVVQLFSKMCTTICKGKLSYVAYSFHHSLSTMATFVRRSKACSKTSSLGVFPPSAPASAFSKKSWTMFNILSVLFSATQTIIRRQQEAHRTTPILKLSKSFFYHIGASKEMVLKKIDN